MSWGSLYAYVDSSCHVLLLASCLSVHLHKRTHVTLQCFAEGLVFGVFSELKKSGDLSLRANA